MSLRPKAIGYLRRDVSGVSQVWDETLIRSTAKRLGYDLAKTIAFGPETDAPVARLIATARRIDAEAVIVPGPAHFDGEIPAEVVRVCDVITVSPENTFARRLWPFDDETA
ncbi:hypothetical protein [Nocardia arthritidis]|uniref:Uncharacterized protein n=1 Tax=Nocardia arthritidis TaxID=228602 RepID=A0A6G9YIK6_9NOCA|nr:hypothetical protein [Nocardia arthritidis]QIS13028.1 hypothetical protein F5544_25870 [Nocardia arthritidis]